MISGEFMIGAGALSIGATMSEWGHEQKLRPYTPMFAFPQKRILLRFYKYTPLTDASLCPTLQGEKSSRLHVIRMS
jgi:hypothetical protein